MKAVEVGMVVEIVKVRWAMLDDFDVKDDVRVEKSEGSHQEQHQAGSGCFEGTARSPSWGCIYRVSLQGDLLQFFRFLFLLGSHAHNLHALPK